MAMNKLFPKCNEAARRISEQHDAPLSGPARLGLWFHLAICAQCKRYSRQISLVQFFVSKYPEHLARIKLPNHTRTEIVRKLMGQQ